MNRLGFYHRFLLGNMAIVVVIVILGSVLTASFINSHHLVEIEANQDLLTRVAQSSFGRLWPMEPAQIDAFCKELSAGGQMRVTFIAPDGIVLGDGMSDPHKMLNHKSPDRLEVLEALRGNPGQDTRHSGTLGVEYRYRARPVTHEGQVVGAVRVAVSTSTMAQSQAFIRNTVVWCALAAIIASALLAVLVSWIWYAPLKRVTQTADELASGNLSARAKINGADELARLAIALNRMRDNLVLQIQTIADQRQDVNTVIANLHDGVIATDGDNQVVLANQAARDLLAIETDPAGMALSSVARPAGILDTYNQAMAGSHPASAQIEVIEGGQRKLLNIHAAKVANGAPGRISGLLVVRDVTEITQAAAMKAEFVANASHELRTPLATARAAVDSLRLMKPYDAQVFDTSVSILDRHIKRLEDLINDLLDLHMIERGSDKLRIEEIGADAVCQWVRANFQRRAQDKGLALVIQAEGPGFAIRSDRKLLEIILQNLLDNAIKFTPDGGQVRFLLKREDGAMLLSVSDTGCGIRPEHQSRVFERFFQGDPARTGDTSARGTGLGLAIVKHAAERLGARITLQSELGQGTTVTLLLPNHMAGCAT